MFKNSFRHPVKCLMWYLGQKFFLPTKYSLYSALHPDDSATPMRISHKEIAQMEGKGALRDSRWRKLLSVRHDAIDSTERERRHAITPPRHASSAVTRKGTRHCRAEPVTGHLQLKLLLSLSSLCFVLVLSKGSYKDETISCHSQKQKKEDLGVRFPASHHCS